MSHAMNRTTFALALSVVGLAPGLASADDQPGIAWSPHASVSLEIVGGGDQLAVIGRLQTGASVALGTGKVRPIAGFGATLGLGSVSFDDPRALDGSVSLGMVDYGPQLQLGVRWGNGGWVDNRAFASVAYLRTSVDDRVRYDPIVGADQTWGVRASIGASWAGYVGDELAGDDQTSLLLAFLPQQTEVVWHRSLGADHFGVAFGWGF